MLRQRQPLNAGGVAGMGAAGVGGFPQGGPAGGGAMAPGQHRGAYARHQQRPPHHMQMTQG